MNIRNAVVSAVLALVATTRAMAADEPKIGFILATMNEERYQKDHEYFLAAAKKYGVSVVFAACDNSERTQASKVENMLAKGIKALVIQPVNSDAAAPFVEAAHKANVPVITYDREINNADVDYYVTQDSYQVGKLQAEAAAKFLNGKGNVLILSGQAGHSVAAEITRGNVETLAKFPGIKVIAQQNHDGWSTSGAMATTENVLTKHKNDIQAILANNSGMASGAVQALEQQKLAGKVFVAGADADLTAIRNIVAGRQHFEVLKALQPLADKSAWLASELAKGHKPTAPGTSKNGKKDVPTFNTDVFPVDKANIDSQIIAYGFHTKADVYQTKN